MFNKYGVRSAIIGLAASFLLMFGDPDGRALAKDDEVKTEWTAKDYAEAKSLICCWKEGEWRETVATCRALGFEIIDTTPNEGVVCKWNGKLDETKLEALKKYKTVRYVEPNFLRKLDLENNPAHQQQSFDFKPVVSSENALDEFKQAKRMICAWEPGKAAELAKLAKSLGLNIVDSQQDKYLVCTWSGELKQETLDKLAADPSIRYIEPDPPRGLTADLVNPPKGKEQSKIKDPSTSPFAVLPQDAFIKDLYGMRNINSPLAWRNVQTSSVVVAVIDTGVDYTHEDLQANMWINPKKGALDKHGADFIDVRLTDDGGKPRSIPGNDPKDRQYHGTHVAGTIGAVGNNKVGVSGVCWRVQIMAVRCLGANGFATASSIAKSIDYAVDNGAKVINLSVGGRKGPSQTELEIVKKAREKGVILVISAGNKADDEIDNDKRDMFPAGYTKFVDNIVVVANTDIKNKLNPGSHFGKTTVHLAAPGTDILSTMPMVKTEGALLEEEGAKKKGTPYSIGTKYGRLTGTSMSAPHTSGSIALMLGHPKFESLIAKSPLEAKNVLFKEAKKLAELDGKMTTGALLDLSFLGEGSVPPKLPPKAYVPPPVEICPNKPPCIIVSPPAHTCPSQPGRVYKQ